MQQISPERITLIGGGPTGATAAALLARAGRKVTLFTGGERPPLIVGESLVPSTVPVLQLLGIEDDVRRISTFKPGATFYVRPEAPLKIDFGGLGGTRFSNVSPLKIFRHSPGTRRLSTPYSYNVPRGTFDDLILQAARKSGVRIIDRAIRSIGAEGSRIITDDPEAVGTELFVDATGRTRLFSRELKLPFSRGTRNDCVIFAHLSRTEIDHPGHIHVNRLPRGWSWRIPLPGKVSVGIVMEAEHWRILGQTPEERYDRMLQTDDTLRQLTAGSERVTPVAVYANYQLITDRFFGENWVLVGDAAGFVDPIFSSGLDLCLNGAVRLSEAILESERGALERYEQAQRENIRSWQLLVESFYDGKLFGLVRAGSILRERLPWKLMVPFLEREIGRAIAGMMPFDSWQFCFCKKVLRGGMGRRFGERLAVR